MRPFLKWPGGKYRLVAQIVSQLPSGRCFVEPFVGSGAIFLNTDYEHYVLNDINPDLINLYNFLKREGQAFIDYARQFFSPSTNTAEVYYQHRDTFNQTDDLRLKSALFLYLNRHGYNGLCRYNQKGIFNVPFGRYIRPYFPETEMKFFAQKAKRAKFKCVDFAKFMSRPPKGAVIYCDPPYVPLTKTARFTHYFSTVFDETAQLRLAQMAERLYQKNVPVLISNHDTELTRQWYQQAQIISYQVARPISCRAASRKAVDELLAIYQPISV